MECSNALKKKKIKEREKKKNGSRHGALPEGLQEEGPSFIREMTDFY